MDGIEARVYLTRKNFTLDISLQCPKQGITALFGPSGSGKTTFLRVMAGLEKSAKATIKVHGECWQDEGVFLPPHRRAMGYVFQEAGLFPHLSVVDNLRYGMKREPAAKKESLDAAIQLLDIGSLLDRAVQKLSGGERQRVAIARALALCPRLLLMDEPLSSLDAARKQDVLPYLEALRHLEIPVIYVSHAADEILTLADYLVILDKGQVTANGKLNGKQLAKEIQLVKAKMLEEITKPDNGMDAALLRALFSSLH